MQISRVSNKSFQGNAILPDRQFFTKMIRHMNENDRVWAEMDLAIKQQDKTAWHKLKDFINPTKEGAGSVRRVRYRVDILEYSWLKAMDNIKKLVTKKLPDEYTLWGYRNKSQGKGIITFSLKKGAESVCSVNATIKDPTLPEEKIKKVVDSIVNPKK